MYATRVMEGVGGGGGEVIQNVYRCVQVLGVEKSVIRYVRTKWMAPNKCFGIFVVHWFVVYQSITARKENVVVFFHHNYNYFILCDN